MFNQLKQTLNSIVPFTDQEFEEVCKFFVLKKYRKKQFLLNQGDVCKTIAFINKGCMKSYITDAKGQERIIQFAIESAWISNMSSLMSGEPSILDIEALEDSEVLLLSREDREKLFAAVPKYEKYSRIVQQNNFIAQQKRIASSILHDADEKYQDFLVRYPALVNRVPQHMIASYLGISPETLSRSRKKGTLTTA